MLPPAMRTNAPVRLNISSLSNDVTVLLGLLHNLNRQPLLGYYKEVYYSERHPNPYKILTYCLTYLCPTPSINNIYYTSKSIFLLCTFEDLHLNVY